MIVSCDQKKRKEKDLIIIKVSVYHVRISAVMMNDSVTEHFPQYRCGRRFTMTHWFHRNPLKATAPVSFNLYGVASSPAANKICKWVSCLSWHDLRWYGFCYKTCWCWFCLRFSDLRTTRARLLDMFTDATCTPEIMKKATDEYFSLLQGLFCLLVGYLRPHPNTQTVTAVRGFAGSEPVVQPVQLFELTTVVLLYFALFVFFLFICWLALNNTSLYLYSDNKGATQWNMRTRYLRAPLLPSLERRTRCDIACFVNTAYLVLCFVWHP